MSVRRHVTHYIVVGAGTSSAKWAIVLTTGLIDIWHGIVLGVVAFGAKTWHLIRSVRRHRRAPE